MKYDLKKIMKRAWEIKKENSRNIFSLCLKMAMQETSAVYFIEQRKKIENYSIVIMSKEWEENQRQKVQRAQ